MEHSSLDPFVPPISLFRLPNAIFELRIHLHLPHTSHISPAGPDASRAGTVSLVVTDVELTLNGEYLVVSGSVRPCARNISRAPPYPSKSLDDQGTLVWTDQPYGHFGRSLLVGMSHGTEPVVLGRHVDSGDYVVRYAVRNKLELKGYCGDAYAGMCDSGLEGGGQQQQQHNRCGGPDFSHHIIEAHQLPYTHTHTHSNSYPPTEIRMTSSHHFQAPTLSACSPCPFHGTRTGSDALDISLLPGGGLQQSLGGNICDHSSQISREVEAMPSPTQEFVQGQSITAQPTNTSNFSKFAPRPVARKGSTCDEAQVRYAESGSQDEDGRDNFNGEAGHSLTQKSKSKSAFVDAGNFHAGVSPGESRSEVRNEDTRGHSNQTQTLKYKSKSVEVGIGMSRPGGVVARSDKIEKLDQELNYNQNHRQLDVSTPHDSARGGRIKMREALDVTVLPGSTGKGGDVVGQIIRNEPSHHGPPDSHMSREPRDPHVSPLFFVGKVGRSGAEGERGRLVDSESQAEDGQQVGDKKGRLTQTGVQIGRFHPDAGGTISGSREQRSTYTGQHSTQKLKSESANLRAGGFNTDVIVSESQTGHSRRQVTDSVALHGASGVRDNLNVVELPKSGEKKIQTRTSTGHEISTPTHTLRYTPHSFKHISSPRPTPIPHNPELEGNTRASGSVEPQDGKTQTPLSTWNLADIEHEFEEIGSASLPTRTPPSGRPDSPIGVLSRSPAQYEERYAEKPPDASSIAKGENLQTSVIGQGLQQEFMQKIGQSTTQQSMQTLAEITTEKTSKRVTFAESSGGNDDRVAGGAPDITVLPGGESTQESITGQIAQRSSMSANRPLMQQSTQASAELESRKSSGQGSITESSGQYRGRDGGDGLNDTILPRGEAGIAVGGILKANQTIRESSEQDVQTSAQQTTRLETQQSIETSMDQSIQSLIQVEIGNSNRKVSSAASSENQGGRNEECQPEVTQEQVQESEKKRERISAQENRQSEYLQDATLEVTQGPTGKFTRSPSPQHPAPLSLSAQIGNAALNVAKEYITATEPESLGGLIKDSAVTVAENAAESYILRTGTRVAGGEQAPGMHTPEGGNVSSQKIGQMMAADEVQDYNSSTRGALVLTQENGFSSREIVQTVTETAQVDDLSSREITKQTATESAQENGSSLRDISQAAQVTDSSSHEITVQTATEPAQENTSLSQDNLEMTTELALQGSSSREIVTVPAMPPQTSTMVERDSSNANVCVSVTEQSGHEQSFDTASGQNVSYSTTVEAVALGNKNVEPAFGADETTGFTVKTDAIMDTTASTDDRNLDANVAVVEEKLDNSEHEEGAQTINTVTNPATGKDLVEASQPVTSPMMEQGFSTSRSQRDTTEVCAEPETHVSDENPSSSSVHSNNLQTINRYASVAVKPTIHTTDSAAYSVDQIQTTSIEQTHAVSTT